MNKRLNYIDTIKGFAILIMILSHSMGDENIIKTWISSFNMPLFFIISGFLSAYKHIEKNEIKNIIKNKLLKLMIPYTVFSLCLTAFYSILKYISNGNVLDCIYTNLTRIITLKGVDSLWFIPCLFIAEITFYLIIINFGNKIAYISSIIIYFVCSYLGNNTNTEFLGVLFKSGVAIVFIAFGHMIYKYVKEKDFSYFFIIIINMINLLLFKFNGFVGLGGFELNNIYLFLICGITGSLGIILLFKKMNSHNLKLLKFLGINTIIILCTNNIIIEIIRLLEYELFGNILFKYKLCESFLLCGIIILIEIPTILICNKYFYYLFGKKKEQTKIATLD